MSLWRERAFWREVRRLLSRPMHASDWRRVGRQRAAEYVTQHGQGYEMCECGASIRGGIMGVKGHLKHVPGWGVWAVEWEMDGRPDGAVVWRAWVGRISRTSEGATFYRLAASPPCETRASALGGVAVEARRRQLKEDDGFELMLTWCLVEAGDAVLEPAGLFAFLARGVVP